MIKSIIFSLIPIIFSVQDIPDWKYDMKRKNLKGNVKSYKEFVFERRYDGAMVGQLVQVAFREIHFNSSGKVTEETEHDTEEKTVKRKSYLYNDSGYQTDMTYTRNGGIIRKYQEKFDKKGNRIETKEFGNDGVLLFTSGNTYNSNGKITETWTIYTDEGKEFHYSSLRESRVFTYDSANNNIEEIVCDKYGQLQGKLFYVYDKSGNRIEMQILDPNNKLLRKALYEYDNRGNKISEQQEPMAKLVHQYDAAGKKTVSKFSEEDYMSYEYNKEGLLEKEKHYTYGRPLNTIVSKYNKTGKLIEEHETNLTWGKSEKRLYKYNKEGNKIEKTCLNNEGDTVEIWTYTYDERGNKLKEMLHDKDMNLRYYEVYLYNEKGQKSKAKQYSYYIPKNFVEKRTNYWYNDKDSLILKVNIEDNGNVNRDTIIYDEKGRETQRISFYGKNKRNTYQEFKYNANGKLIGAGTFNGDGTLQSRVTYQYNEKEGLTTTSSHNSKDEIYLTSVSKYNTDGLLLSREEHRKNGMEYKTTYAYDDKQQLLEEVFYDGNGEKTSTTQYQYKYDNTGNLIRKYKELTEPVPEVTDLTNYEIVYY